MSVDTAKAIFHDQSREIERAGDRRFGIILRKAALTAAVIVTVLNFYPRPGTVYAPPVMPIQQTEQALRIEPLPLAPMSIEESLPAMEPVPAPVAAEAEQEFASRSQPGTVPAAPERKRASNPLVTVVQRLEAVTLPSRSRDEIEAVFMHNRHAISDLYTGALRRDPTLKGMLVLRMRIEPQGNVTECEVVSSEIRDEALLRELIERVRRFRFEDRNVAPITTVKPIDFYSA